MVDCAPDIVQVVPNDDYTVFVYFVDGKIVCYDVKPKLESGLFQKLKDLDVFVNRCSIMNDTLAWDIKGNGDPSECLDIDPETLYALEACEETLAS